MSLLPLKNATPLSKGSVRLVFGHPGSPDLLVKVVRPDLVERRYTGFRSWLKPLRRYDPYAGFLRELQEFIAGYAALGRPAPFAQSVHGLVETDLGLGLVVGAVRGPDGALAPTLAKLISAGGFDGPARRALDETLDALLQSDIVLADLHERNLVYQNLAGGTPRFVMIDGIGASTLIPCKNWSRLFNRYSKWRRILRLRQRVARRVEAFDAGNPAP